MSVLPADIFQRNLAALRERFGDLASLLQATAIRADFTPTAGADGTRTFVRTVSAEGRKRLDWLGGTSMPRASAAALVASLEPGAGNGLGLSIGTGFEWAAFLDRLPPALAVYVYEPEAALLRMALTICNLAAPLAAGRLIVVTGQPDDAGAALAGFLDAHAGYDPPAVLHPLPTLGARRHELLTAGEAIVRRAVMGRQARLTQLQANLASGGELRSDRCLALTLTPRYAAERPLHAEIARRRIPEIRLDRHDSAGQALRMERLAETRAGRIVSDVFRPQLGCIPENIPVETWIAPLAGAAIWDRVPQGQAFRLHDRIIVHAGAHRARLLDLGVPEGHIELRLLAPVGAAVQKAASTAASRVAIFGDLPRCDAESLGINLPTHQAVFAAASELIRADYLGVHPGMAPDLLRRALARAGVGADTKDPALGEPMLRIIRDVLVPTLPLLALAQALAEQSVPVTLLGDWPKTDFGALSERVSVRRFGEADFPNFAEVALLVHLSPTGVVSPVIWQAIGAEVAIVAPEHPADGQAGSMADLLKGDADYARPRAQNLIGTVKALLRDAARRMALARAAQRRLEAANREHAHYRPQEL